MKFMIARITVFGFLLIIVAFSISFILAPDRPFSEQENRALRTRPSFSLSALTSGAYAEQINEYFADQFPLRDLLVSCKAYVELSLGKGENDGILLGANGCLARRMLDVRRSNGTSLEDCDVLDSAHLRASAEGINRLSRGLDVPLTVLLAGRNVDVCASSFAYLSSSSAATEQMMEALSPQISFADTVSDLRARHEAGEKVYYRTDHHWTTYGAYLAYRELMRTMGMEDAVLPMDFFEVQTVSDAFYGSLWSAGGMKFVAPDSMEVWFGEDEGEYEVVADGKVLDGFYQFSHVEKKDKYSIFLDGTHDVVTVSRKDGEVRPRLMLVKDSFANSLAPFLARHFDLVLLNLSSKTDFTNASERAAEYGADRVVLVYSLENIITADRAARLK